MKKVIKKYVPKANDIICVLTGSDKWVYYITKAWKVGNKKKFDVILILVESTLDCKDQFNQTFVVDLKWFRQWKPTLVCESILLKPNTRLLDREGQWYKVHKDVFCQLIEPKSGLVKFFSNKSDATFPWYIEGINANKIVYAIIHENATDALTKIKKPKFCEDCL